MPGQFVAVRYCGAGSGSTDAEDCSRLVVARKLYSLASSPYEARRDSAMLDASLVELLVSRAGGWQWQGGQCGINDAPALGPLP